MQLSKDQPHLLLDDDLGTPEFMTQRVDMLLLFKIVHMVAAVFLVLVVLLQSGRGGGMGTALSGATGQIFGGRGANTFLTRLTSGTAMVFFCTSLTLSILSSHHHSVVRAKSGRALPAQTQKDSAKAADQGDEQVEKASTSDHLEGSQNASAPEATDPGAPEPTPPGVPSGATKP